MSFPKIGVVGIHKLFAKSENAWLNIRAWSERFPEDVIIVWWDKRTPPPASCDKLPRVLYKGVDVCRTTYLDSLFGDDFKAIAEMVDPKDRIRVDSSDCLQQKISSSPDSFLAGLPPALPR